MLISRRQAVGLMGTAAGAWLSRRVLGQQALAKTHVPFAGTRESLKTYRTPEWFADAKFGIWAHWGPQSAIEDGDWYARRMYVEGSDQYKYHLERFGPQSKVGYKDLIHLFTAERWNPEGLMDLYVAAGAKYFVSMGVHHDNFDMWNSRFQPRWNSMASGPRKDVVGLWAKAARKRGLRFGVSDHLSNSYDWLAPSHLSDKTGPYAGVPYDGTDPAFADLYHNYKEMPTDFATTAKPMGLVAPDRWKLEYFRRIKDLIDQHAPDLLYTDGGIPFEEYGLALVAETYNVSAGRHGGRTESVYTSKHGGDCAVGTCALDRERGVLDGIQAAPWQTDTCIGEWHYKKGATYKSAKKVIDLLVDIVSKNGNLLLNFPLPASGELDAEERVVLRGITEWMRTNSEGIHSSRPWKIHGEGPSISFKPGPRFNESKIPQLTAQDIRFTTKTGALYAFVQGWPDAEVAIQSLGSGSAQSPGRVTSVELLGVPGELKFQQQTDGLRVTLRSARPPGADIGVALRIRFS